jgi:hypothetical protein
MKILASYSQIGTRRGPALLSMLLQPVVAGGLGHYRDHSPDAFRSNLSIFELQLQAALIFFPVSGRVRPPVSGLRALRTPRPRARPAALALSP